jgi:hypothetical protein
MPKAINTLIAEIRARVHSLLYDEVIQHTIVVMRELGNSLSQLASQVRGVGPLTDEQKVELREILLPLTSESIREALHKGELHITNGIIRSKNTVLTAIGVPIPEGHAEIDARNYPNYNW